MKRAIVLQHVPFEGPARLGAMLEERGIPLEVRRLDLGAKVPEQLEEGELLVVMGGPMGVADLGSPDYPFLEAEAALIRRCLESEAPILGVCLGAQLMAHVAGAEVRPMTNESGERVFEVGWAKIRLADAERDNPVLRGLPADPLVLHWHGDACALPANARRLASTGACENQAFQIGARAFGLQFHCEADEAAVEAFLEADSAFVERANGPRGVEMVREQTRAHLDEAWRAGRMLLENILDRMTQEARS